jgi:MFS transporter, YNFM family, putative membrane transport protein
MNSGTSLHNLANDSNSLDKAGLFALCVAAFTSMSSMRLCDPLLPALAQSFGTSTGNAAYTISAFAVSYGLLQLFFGPLGDRYGKFRVISIAVLTCTIGNVVAMMSGDLEALVLARALSGATAGGIIPLSLAWVGDSVAYERRQEVLGHLMVATLLGTAFGQWMSGVLVDVVGWRWPFGVTATMFAVTGLALLRMSRGRSGALLATSSPIGFLQGMVVVLRMRWARWILALTVLEGAFAFSAVSFVPSFLHDRFAMPLNQAAAIVALFAGGGLIYALQARRMVAWMGERGLALFGSGAMGVCLIGMALMRHSVLALPACFFAGLGFAMLHATLQTHATQMAPTVRGTATALFGASIFLGQSLGILLAAYAVDQGGFHIVFAVAGTVIIVTGAAFARSLSRS